MYTCCSLSARRMVFSTRKTTPVRAVIQLDAVCAPQQGAGDFFPSSTSRSMSVVSLRVVAKTQTGMINATTARGNAGFHSRLL